MFKKLLRLRVGVRLDNGNEYTIGLFDLVLTVFNVILIILILSR